MLNHLYSEVYLEGIRLGDTFQKLLRVPAVVKNLGKFIRKEKNGDDWRKLSVYFNSPNKGVIAVDVKLYDKYYVSNHEEFVEGSNIEIVVYASGVDKGVASARVINDDWRIIYDWNYLAKNENEFNFKMWVNEGKYFDYFMPKFLVELSNKFLELCSENRKCFEENSSSLHDELFKSAVLMKSKAQVELAMEYGDMGWSGMLEEVNEAFLFYLFLNEVASKWDFKRFRKSIRSLVECKDLSYVIVDKVKIQKSYLFYDVFEVEQYSWDESYFQEEPTEVGQSGFNVDDYYNDQLDLDQQDPEFYNRL